MKSLRPSRVLLIAGSLAWSAVFVSACSVDGTGLEQVEDGGSDGSEPDGTGPSGNTDAGDATTEDGSDAASPNDGSSAEGGDGGAKPPGADAAAGADAGDATIATDGEVDATVDASVDAGGSGGFDAAEPDVVGDGPTPVDAPEDVAIPEDTEDADTTDASVEDTGADADLVDAGSDAETVPVTTTSVISNALGDPCAYGALLANCLTTPCESLSGMTGSSTDTSLCLATLACAISGSTATTYCGMRSDTTNECYCGDADPPDCKGGLADGVCIAPEEAGFSPNDPASIYDSYTDTAQPSGVANFIANCMYGVPLCRNAADL
ncbi:MAG TPA: hypothetical protein VK841_23485 [Polyangiaceae bacterium]|jgi:hypothetical protein|nr:hypothetical protein [Polyangiaceae bacterium]